MNRNHWRKYLAFVRIAATRTWRAPGELAGRMVFFAVILGVFASLWNVVAEAGMPIAATPRSLVWYLAITEWIVLSAPAIHVDIQEAIRRGDVACQLGRPVSFVGALFAEGLGTLAVRAPVLFATACLWAFVFTHEWPAAPVLLAVGLIGLAAAALLTALCVGIGLLAFWLGDIQPVWWVFQKSMFVFGGLMMPVALYPGALRAVAPLTPFPATLSGPASLVLHGQPADAGAVVATLGWWAALTTLGLWGLSRRAARRVTINGG